MIFAIHILATLLAVGLITPALCLIDQRVWFRVLTGLLGICVLVAVVTAAMLGGQP